MTKNLSLILFLLLSWSSHSENLEPTRNADLEFFLNNLIWVGDVKSFESYDFEARIYKTSSSDSCAILYECRATQALYIATTEGDGDEMPVKFVYKLPGFHLWELLHWDNSESNKPEVHLKSTNYLKNGTTESKSYILKLTYISAKLETL